VDAAGEHGDWIETNRAWWDERAELHEASGFYDLDAFVEHPDRLRPYEIEDLGDVEGLDLVHLQCHLGTDTLSWATRGARVVGLDFSAPGIEAARRLAARLGYDDGRATFVVSDVYDAVEALDHRTFDIVYTGFGALDWLDDIERWADVATALVAPGGRLYVAEFHPFTGVFGEEELEVTYGYWERGRYPGWGSYVGEVGETSANEEALRNHTIGEVVTAVAERGLLVRSLREHDWTLFARWPWLEVEPGTHDTYRMPAGRPALPLVWTLLAQRPHQGGSS
jgi:SAM-dependent methyltransferase